MGKGKPRHNPDKPQNNYNHCPYTCSEEIEKSDGSVYIHCEEGRLEGNVTNICGRNRYNCLKVQLR